MSLKARQFCYTTSVITSLLLVWLYFGLHPFGVHYGFFPPHEGTILNEVMRLVALPLALLLMVGGGMMAGYAISDDFAPERQKAMLAVSAPPGVLWIFVCGLGLQAEVAYSFYLSLEVMVLTAIPIVWIVFRMVRHRVLTQ